MRRLVRALAALLVAGCAARRPSEPLSPSVRRLAAELDSAFDAPEFARAEWGVVVQSLDNGEILYRRNAARLFKPASNMKLITGAAALVTLGADYRYMTPVLSRGVRHGDTLLGDLLVLGRGDPTISQRASGGDDILAPLRPWADSLRSRGIRVIAGRVVGDGTWFPDPALGEGWMWDDLPESYSAPIGALQFNEGFAVVEVSPGTRAGDTAPVRLLPARAPLVVSAAVTTAPADSNVNRVRWTRVFFTDSVPLAGRLSARHAPVRIEVAVRDPVRYFEAALTQVLEEAGIRILGRPSAVAPNCATAACPLPPDTLFVWQSPPLGAILPLLEKPSQNQIAEALLRTLGERRGVASVDSGRAVIRDVLRSFGVPDDAYRIADGSGVSHYNYVAPEAIAQVLFSIGRRPDFALFYDALPIAGVDGTLEQRMRGGAAQGNARAKTGDISGARTLSGYVTTRDGERLLFVLMANHFTFPRRVVDAVQDRLVERMANFSRAER